MKTLENKMTGAAALAPGSGSAVRPETFAVTELLTSPSETVGRERPEGVSAPSPRTYAQLCDDALRLGVTIQNCWRDDENSVCRPCVNVNRNGNDFVWRLHDKTKPKSYLVALESAMDEAEKLWGVTRQPNDKLSHGEDTKHGA